MSPPSAPLRIGQTERGTSLLFHFLFLPIAQETSHPVFWVRGGCPGHMTHLPPFIATVAMEILGRNERGGTDRSLSQFAHCDSTSSHQ